jgi:hypothetical protein
MKLGAKLGGHELQAVDVDGDRDIDLCSKPWSGPSKSEGEAPPHYRMKPTGSLGRLP